MRLSSAIIYRFTNPYRSAEHRYWFCETVQNESITTSTFCKKFQIPFEMLREFLHSKWQYQSNSRANCLPASFPVNVWIGRISMWDENLFWRFLHGKKKKIWETLLYSAHDRRINHDGQHWQNNSDRHKPKYTEENTQC